MGQFGFYFNTARCTGCKTCMMACKDYHDLGVGNTYRHVYDCEGGTWRLDGDGAWESDAFLYHIAMGCNHCAAPACTKVCPTGAMSKNARGIVSVDADRCLGCGYCTLACPYHAPHIDPVLKKSSKCNACAERIDVGLAPICVEACPLRALDYGELSELQSTYDSASAVPMIPSPAHTGPSVVIGPAPALEMAAASDTVFLANILEVL